MISIKDQSGSIVEVKNYPPKRIVSLVPSQTELLYDLGLDEEIVGITKFCVHPEKWFRNKTRIGGTKNLNIKRIKFLQPDLIIANKEENVKEQIDELKQTTPVFVSDVSNMEKALEMINMIGMITGKNEQANTLAKSITTAFEKLTPNSALIPACYLIWKDPYITIGGDTFINDMMKRCGLQNVFENEKRYPETTIEEILQRGCKLILLSSEPFPFKEKHVDEIRNRKFEIENLKFETEAVKIMLVDGEMFSWYGSRMLKAADYLNKLTQSYLI